MTAAPYRRGDAVVAWLLALLATGISLAVLVTLVLVADSVASNSGVYAGEVFSSFLYFLIFGTALTFVFGIVPFTVVGFVLMQLRTLSLAAFALAGIAAGAAAAFAFLLATARDTAGAVAQVRTLAFEDLTGAAVLLAGAFGGLAARHYLKRAAARANPGGV